MRKRFVAAREDEPGAAWRERFRAGRDEAARWYLANSGPAPDAATCRAALARHMPELLGQYDRACDLLGDDELGHRIISHYRPAPQAHGCSQAVWLGPGGPALLRNYDYSLDIVSDRFESTAWFGRRVIAKAQRPWGGCLDGMNRSGLVASLTAGGDSARGIGFSIILMLRYVLETCDTVAGAAAALCRIPVAQSQNVTLLDRSGAHATLFLGPDRETGVSAAPVCTNHQDRAGSPSLARTASLARHAWLSAALDDPATTLETLQASFFRPPLHVREPGFSTVYTAVYRPAEGVVEYLWPGHTWRQSFECFTPGEYTHDYAA